LGGDQDAEFTFDGPVRENRYADELRCDSQWSEWLGWRPEIECRETEEFHVGFWERLTASR